uniref:Uncharacterized protein n=1 Tax=Romanomermis culicivorax TaxID=13658 RepID=A0A915I3B7_ROMCU
MKKKEGKENGRKNYTTAGAEMCAETSLLVIDRVPETPITANSNNINTMAAAKELFTADDRDA